MPEGRAMSDVFGILVSISAVLDFWERWTDLLGIRGLDYENDQWWPASWSREEEDGDSDVIEAMIYTALEHDHRQFVECFTWDRGQEWGRRRRMRARSRRQVKRKGEREMTGKGNEYMLISSVLLSELRTRGHEADSDLLHKAF